MTEQQIDKLLMATDTLTDCVFNLISANRDLFQMLTVVTGIRRGYQEPDDVPIGDELTPKVDMTGKPITF